MVKNTIINKITLEFSSYSIGDNDTNNCHDLMLDSKKQ